LSEGKQRLILISQRQDNRYSHLHCSDAAIRMLEFAFEDEEQDFGKMTGFDEGTAWSYWLMRGLASLST